MDLVLAIPILVALVIALVYVRHLWRRQQQRLHALRKSTGQALRPPGRRRSARSEMREGEDTITLPDEMSSGSGSRGRRGTPSVGK